METTAMGDIGLVGTTVRIYSFIKKYWLQMWTLDPGIVVHLLSPLSRENMESPQPY